MVLKSRGFMLGAVVPLLSGESVLFALPHPRGWSEEGLRVYDVRRVSAAAVVQSALALDLGKVCVVDGVFVARPHGDPLPGFDLGSKDAIDLFTAQIACFAHEASVAAQDLEAYERRTAALR